MERMKKQGITAEFTVAVHALVYLLHKKECVSSSSLADNICTNPARIRKIMGRLQKAGMVESVRGRSSGYRIAEDGAEITLAAVMKALDESPVIVNWRSGDTDNACMISSNMGSVMNDLYEQMDRKCMEVLNEKTIGSICRSIEKKERRNAK